jgi:hypothetical protein
MQQDCLAVIIMLLVAFVVVATDNRPTFWDRVQENVP